VSQKNDWPHSGKPSLDILFIESKRSKKNADHAKINLGSQSDGIILTDMFLD
jgi:hypothetical protein